MPGTRGNTFVEFLGLRDTFKLNDEGTLLEFCERVGRVKPPKCSPSALSGEDAADRGLPDSNL